LAAANPFEFDAAISFLTADLALAEELKWLCSPSPDLFVYSRNQEVVAATDGLERFREVFRDRARISVVLHRRGWGQTPWTGVEDIAIRDRCLATKYRSLVLVRLDDAPTPKWVPDTYIHLDLRNYSVEQLAGVIKARCQELGATLRAPTAVELAKRRGQEEAFRQETERYIMTPEGMQAGRECAQKAFVAFVEGARQLSVPGAGWDPQAERDGNQAVGLLAAAAVQLLWQPRWANSLRDSSMRLRSFDGHIQMPGRKEIWFAPDTEVTSEETFSLIRTSSMGLCWQRGKDRPLSSQELGEHAIAKLAEAAERAQARRR